MAISVLSARPIAGPASPSAPFRKRRTQPWTPWLFLVPGLVLFAVTFAWPAVIAVQLAFSRYDVVHPVAFVGLDNFAEMLVDDRFHKALLNSALFLLMFLPLVVILPLFLAMLVNVKLRGVQAFRAVYYLPGITSMVAVAVAWQLVLGRTGAISWLLTLVGLDPVSFLLDPNLALPAVVAIEAWKGMGFYMMIYLAGLQAIPPELIEAAKVDGASGIRRFWYVIVPGMRPIFAVTLTLAMLSAAQAFESVFVLTRGGPQDSTLTIGYYVWQKAFEQHDMGYASAVGLFLWAIMIVLSLLNLRATRTEAN